MGPICVACGPVRPRRATLNRPRRTGLRAGQAWIQGTTCSCDRPCRGVPNAAVRQIWPERAPCHCWMGACHDRELRASAATCGSGVNCRMPRHRGATRTRASMSPLPRSSPSCRRHRLHPPAVDQAALPERGRRRWGYSPECQQDLPASVVRRVGSKRQEARPTCSRRSPRWIHSARSRREPLRRRRLPACSPRSTLQPAINPSPPRAKRVRPWRRSPVRTPRSTLQPAINPSPPRVKRVRPWRLSPVRTPRSTNRP